MSVPVRPCDIPPEVRLAAVPSACQHGTGDERQEILQAALFPSDRIYWMPDTVRPLVEQWKKAA